MATCPKCGGFLRGGGAEECMNCSMAFQAEKATCPHCKSDVPAGATVCRYCTRDIKPPSSPVSGETLIGCFGVVFLVFVLYMAFSPSTSSNRTVSESASERTINIEAACAKGQSALSNLLSAAKSQDTAAVSGLILRGEVLPLHPGDKVKVISTNGGVSHVRLLSGFNIGTRCEIPESMLR